MSLFNDYESWGHTLVAALTGAAVLAILVCNARAEPLRAYMLPPIWMGNFYLGI